MKKMINIVVTSKPVDGLLYYSYEYCSYLNAVGIDARVIIICHRTFLKQDYIKSISNKYMHCKNVVFDIIDPAKNDITLILGRSMMTLSWIDYHSYKPCQKKSLKKLFGGNIISVYSENHPTQYPLAVKFYNPLQIIDLCDTEVYPNGVGKHFEKTINFSIYKPHTVDVKFKYLFLGTNNKYYATVEKYIKDYPDHGILTYDADYVNIKNNNIFVPVENLMSMFETYVYTKATFDPAPRIFQECKFYGKDVIYLRDKTIIDGGSVYWKRDIKEPDITAIVNAVERLNENRP
jgi:hypothetical protein